MNDSIILENLGRVFVNKVRKKDIGGLPEKIIALDNINLSIAPGELFGLLGPNGAGKTTLIKILCTLLLPTSGKASVKGLDVSEKTHEIRKIINMVSGGENPGYGLLNVRENLWFFSQLYGIPYKEAFSRIDELLEMVGMKGFEKLKIHKLSTGMKQKVNFVRGFINDPEVLFLDEPTLGLDVNAARDIRQFVKRWIKENRKKTVLLTTHYMMEADELCDRVAIIDKGKIIACDTPENLKKLVKKETVFELEVRNARNHWEELEKLEGVHRLIALPVEDGASTNLKFILKDDFPLDQILSTLVREGAQILAVKKSEPNLEDVFIELVGKGLKD